jgi:hypothetical protein
MTTMLIMVIVIIIIIIIIIIIGLVTEISESHRIRLPSSTHKLES